MHRNFLKQLSTVPDQEKSTVISTFQYYKCYEAYKGLRRRDMRKPIDDHKEYIQKDIEKDYLSKSPLPLKRKKIQ